MLFFIFTFNNGEIRSYVFIGIILGIIFYMLLISRLFMKISVSIILIIKKIIYYPLSLIWKAFKFTLINPITFLSKKRKNTMPTFNKKNT